jgi:LysR family nitrogen assimilation transcriptional regulator
MEFRDLEVFVEIARLGGFNRAAAQLHIAQSALSRRVGLLEHEIGTALFLRSKRGVRLTPAGTYLLSRAEGLLHRFDQVRAEALSEAGEPRGNISIGFPPSLIQHASLVVSSLRGAFPLLFVRSWVATTVELRKMLVNGTLDVAVFAATENDPLIGTAGLFKDVLHLTYPKSMVLSQSVTWKMVSSVPLILPGRPNSIRVMVDDAAAKRHLRLNVIAEVNDIALLLELIQNGEGCGILPNSVLNRIDFEHLAVKRVPQLSLHWVVGHLKEHAPSVACTRTLETIQALITAPDTPEARPGE